MNAGYQATIKYLNSMPFFKLLENISETIEIEKWDQIELNNY